MAIRGTCAPGLERDAERLLSTRFFPDPECVEGRHELRCPGNCHGCLLADRKTHESSRVNQRPEVGRQRLCEGWIVDQRSDLDVSVLRGFREIGRSHERTTPVNNDALRVERCLLPRALLKGARVVVDRRNPRSGPVVASEGRGKACDELFGQRGVARPASNVEKHGYVQARDLTHPLRELTENLAAAVHGEACYEN